MSMKLFTVDGDALGAGPRDELVDVLEHDGIICFPAENNYRLGASAFSAEAVGALIAAKRRSSHAPSLVFVKGPEMLERVAAQLSPLVRTLARELWPGPVTLLVEPSDAFPPKVHKAIAKATGLIGVRVPAHPVARAVVEAFGKPILVTSANISRKKGATSPAQVRKNFGRQVEAMVDLGDLPPGTPSTLVDLSGGAVSIRRQGAVSEETIRGIIERAAG
jgi:L-threonylcarbamoyladenylate synthase